MASFPDVCTLMIWMYPTVIDTTFQVVMEKTPTNYADYRGFGVNNLSGSIAAYMRRGISDIDVESVAGTLVANKWQFVAVQFDATGTNDSDQKILIGDLTTPAAEVSYSKQLAGSGSPGASTAPVCIGNNLFSESFPGILDFPAIVGRKLSLAEIWAYQFRPHLMPGATLFMPFGDPVLERDLALGFHGTPFGAPLAVSPPVPFGSRPRGIGRIAFDPSAGVPVKRDGMFFGAM